MDPMDEPAFDDWVNHVYSFMHFLNLLWLPVLCPEIQATFSSKAVNEDDTTKDPAAASLLSYDSFPWSEKSCEADEHLHHICNWFATLQWPADFTENVYTTFLRYTLHLGNATGYPRVFRGYLVISL